MIGLNSFQHQALIDLKESGFDAYPSGNWIRVTGGYRDEPIYTVEGVDSYISNNEPPA